MRYNSVTQTLDAEECTTTAQARTWQLALEILLHLRPHRGLAQRGQPHNGQRRQGQQHRIRVAKAVHKEDACYDGHLQIACIIARGRTNKTASKL